MNERSGAHEQSGASNWVSGASEQTSEWPSSFLSIHSPFEPQCSHRICIFYCMIAYVSSRNWLPFSISLSMCGANCPNQRELFLDAPSHLYKRLCPSVRQSIRPRSVRPSVRPSVRLSIPNYFRTRTRRILCRASGLVFSGSHLDLLFPKASLETSSAPRWGTSKKIHLEKVKRKLQQLLQRNTAEPEAAAAASAAAASKTPY